VVFAVLGQRPDDCGAAVQALSGTTSLYALVETGAGGYTPLSGEVETLLVSTHRDQ
jgi:hypothetical protein